MSVEQSMTPEQIMANMPQPNYKRNFQPNFTDHAVLNNALQQMRKVVPVTTVNNVESVAKIFAKIAQGDPRTVVISGHFSETVGTTRRHKKRAKAINREGQIRDKAPIKDNLTQREW